MKKYFTTLIFLICMAGIIFVQYRYDIESKKFPFTEPTVFRPEIIKAADLGLNNAAADFTWLSAIQYFGGFQSKKYQELPDYLALATDLDPKFSYPYAFGVIILPNFGYTDQSIELAKKGIQNSKPDWRIPYYLAATYHMSKNDPVNAAKYFDIAANTPGVPDGIKKVAARYGSRSDKRTQTEQIWTGVYETSTDEVVKERAKNYLIHFEIMDLLEAASKQYYSANKKYPATPDDLVTARILKAIPPDPFGFQFDISQTDGIVTTK